MSGKVLIVMPTYLRSHMFKRAIESALAQDYEDWHLALVINGLKRHPEQTEKYLKEYPGIPNDKVTLVLIQERGIGQALNAGLGKSWPFKWEYWMNLEDDDTIDPTYLSKMVDALESHTNCGVVNCLQRQKPKEQQSNGGPITWEILNANWINWPQCLWRKSVYDEVGPIAEDVGPAVDWDWHIRCMYAGVKYYHLPQTLMTHYWHNTNYCTHVDGRPIIAKKIARGDYKKEKE